MNEQHSVKTYKFKNTEIIVLCGNIISMTTDAIVNSANVSLQSGSGLCGAIFKAAGEKELSAECEQYGQIDFGQAVITGAYNLPSRKIIHVTAPKWYMKSSRMYNQMENCYRGIIHLCEKYKLKSVAVPCIGMGIYLWPIEIGSRIAVDTVIANLTENTCIENIYFVCSNEEQYKEYISRLDSIFCFLYRSEKNTHRS